MVSIQEVATEILVEAVLAVAYPQVVSIQAVLEEASCLIWVAANQQAVSNPGAER